MEILYACIYCIIYFYILWLNYCIGKVDFNIVEFFAVKIITLFNMLLSIYYFIEKVESVFVLHSVTMPYFIALLCSISKISNTKTKSKKEISMNIYIGIFTTVILTFMSF